MKCRSTPWAYAHASTSREGVDQSAQSLAALAGCFAASACPAGRLGLAWPCSSNRAAPLLTALVRWGYARRTAAWARSEPLVAMGRTDDEALRHQVVGSRTARLLRAAPIPTHHARLDRGRYHPRAQEQGRAVGVALARLASPGDAGGAARRHRAGRAPRAQADQPRAARPVGQQPHGCPQPDRATRAA